MQSSTLAGHVQVAVAVKVHDQVHDDVNVNVNVNEGWGCWVWRRGSTVRSVDLALVATDALRLALALALPALIASFTLSLLLAFFELLTQGQDATLGFAPRLVAVAVTLFVGREFMASELVRFTTQLFVRITQLAR